MLDDVTSVLHDNLDRASFLRETREYNGLEALLFFLYAPVVFLLLVKALPRYDEDDAATLVVVARNVTSAVVYVLADENHALVLQLLRLVGLNYRSKYGRGALPSTHGVPHESAAKKGHYLTQWAENPSTFL